MCHKIVRSFKRSIYLACVGLSLVLVSLSSHAETTVIRDILGREVTVQMPLERVFLGFYYTDYMAIGGVDAFDKVVGFSKDVWTVWTPASWELYSSQLPQLNDIPDVGEVEAGTFSLEKLLSLNPDLAVLADWQFKALGPDVDRIEAAGIPVVVVDYNAQTLERHLQSTLILGQITGQEARAQQIADEYQANVEEVAQRIAASDLAKPRVYVEFGNKGPAEYSFTYGKNMWGSVINLAGGDNIATPFVEWWGPMNPEQVLVSNPEVIIISGRETELTKNQEAMVLGVGIEQSEAERRLQGFSQRAGWSELDAIQKGQLFGVYQGASRTIADSAMVQYFAKVFYPELFADLDPLQTYLDFHAEYLPVVPQGTFMVHADQAVQ